LKDNPNLFLILCGHMHGENMRTETYAGNTVYILLADYQDYTNGGNGYLRMMEFCPETNQIKVKSYSPHLNQYLTDADSQFTLPYNMTTVPPSPDVEQPVIALNSPADGSTLTSSSIEFDVTATDNLQLINATLYYGDANGSTGPISLVQQKTFATTYNSPGYGISVTLDTPATTNNLLVTGVAIDKASGTISVPSGFTLVQKGEGGISSGAMAYKIATGGETTISWSWTAHEEGSVWIGEYAGLVPTDVLDVSSENEAYLSIVTNTISTGTTPTTTQAYELAITLFASDSGNAVGNTRTWSNGFSTVAEITDTSGSPFANVGSKILDSTGAVESTLTHNGNDESYAMIATFKAAPLGTIWHAEGTNSINGTTDTTSFTITIPDGEYKWNCRVYDEAGNSAFASSNYTFTVDTSAPPTYYTLTTHVIGNGIITPASGSSFAAGSVVNVEAKPDSGYAFDSWNGDLSGTDNSTTITMNGDKDITATFTELPAAMVVWTSYDDLAGSYSLPPTYPCVTNYHSGNSGHLKDYATGDLLPVSVSVTGGTNNGTAPGLLAPDTDAYRIFSGKINPDQILYYNSNHVITFTGLDPSKTYRFVHWADRADSGYTSRYSTVTISDVTSFTTNSSTGVTISTSVMTDDSASYCTGYNINGYVAGFTSINPGPDGDFTITVTSADGHQYSTAFMVQELSTSPSVYYSLTVNVVGNGVVTPASGSTHLENSIVTVQAIPDTGWQFSGWSGDLTGGTNPATITMNSDKTITATFTEQLPWIAYNDLAGANSPSPATNYHSGSTGYLKDYNTGTTLTIQVAVSGGSNDGTGPGVLTVGTDAYSIFNGKINPDRVLAYTGGTHVFTFTGLDPNKLYRFVHWGDRADPTNTNSAKIVISDVTSFIANSTAGVTISTTTLPDDSATYLTGYNSLNGYIAGFTNINPGSDGDMTIKVSGATGSTKWYSNAFMLMEIPT
jgi:hypothetical protein